MGSEVEIHLCPKSHPPSRHLAALRLEELTSFAWDMRLTLSCLQGLANRSQPQLYLLHDRYDELWLNWLRERGDIDTIEWLEVGQVFERWLPAAADPGALRVVNEFGIDYAIDWQERRRAALLTLLADLKARNVPVQAVGLQAHLDAAEPALDHTVLNRFVSDIAGLGMKVIVTELDVRDDRLPADIATRDAAVAAHARAWLEAVLVHPAVLGVLTWGLSDKRSWLNKKFPRPDGLPQRPLPLDAAMRRKPLWSALAAALDTAPARPGRG